MKVLEQESTMRSIFRPLGNALCALSLITSSAFAQADGNYPNRPINLIVPWPAGGSVDFVARIVATQLSRELQQPVVIDNKPGASGNIGATAGARAKADGYTLVMASPSMATASSLYRKLSYDLIKDFVPVSRLGEAPYVLVVKPAIAATAMQLVARAKANPGTLTFASSGAGGQPHLLGEAFKTNASIDILHVPYKGAPQAVSDLVGGTWTCPSTVRQVSWPCSRWGSSKLWL
nr:tripartite tricarboxylate transporter substrate-binding protein [Hydrogenophaga sp. 2FB]